MAQTIIFNPILYLHEYNNIPADILRWKNDEELKPWKPGCTEELLFQSEGNPTVGAGKAAQAVAIPPRLYVGIGTYKTTEDGEIYLCALIAPDTRKVEAYSLGVYRSAELVGKALENLFAAYGKPEAPIVICSSQNPLYKTKLYGEILSWYPVRAEMTEKGTRGGVMAVSTFYSQLMRRKGSVVFRDWQEAVDWLSGYVFRYNRSKGCGR